MTGPIPNQENISPPRRIRTLNVLSDGRKNLENALSTEGVDLGLAGEISEIKVTDEQLKDGYKIDEKNKQIIILQRETYENVLKAILSTKDTIHDPKRSFIENKDFKYEDTGEILGLGEKEKIAQKKLIQVSNLLKRVHGRKTGMTSWILFGLLKSYGYVDFRKDDFKNVEKDLLDINFIKTFSDYYSKHKSGEETQAEEILDKAYGSDSKKKSLTKLAANVLSVCDKIPKWVIEKVPMIFCVQNVAVPILTRVFGWLKQEGPIVKILETMKMINPWLDEFGAGTIGIFKKEATKLKDHIKSFEESKSDQAEEKNPASKLTTHDDIESIKLTELTPEEYKFKQMIKSIHEASDRFLGRKSTLSSLALNTFLWYKGLGNFQSLAEKTFKDDKFVKQLYSYLKDIKEKGEDKVKIEDHIKDTTNQKVALVTKFLMSLTSSKNMSNNWIDKYPKWFGMFYAPQYLIMPLFTKLFDKGIIKWVLEVIRDVNPLLNDALFDPLATFREEVIGLRDASVGNEDLIPNMPKTVEGIFDKMKNFIDMIKKLPVTIKNTFAGEAPSAESQPAT